MIERIADGEAFARQILKTSPQQLRDIATRMEAMMGTITSNKQSVQVPVTSSLLLVWDPELSTDKLRRRIAESVEDDEAT